MSQHFVFGIHHLKKEPGAIPTLDRRPTLTFQLNLDNLERFIARIFR
jgi:hypothetical protein